VRSRTLLKKEDIMKLNIYTIYDTASGLYLRPFFAQSDGEAVRSFSDIIQDADHPIGKHPEDYSIHRIGIYDDNTAKLTDENNECLSTALELVAKSRNVNRDNIELLDQGIAAGGTA